MQRSLAAASVAELRLLGAQDLAAAESLAAGLETAPHWPRSAWAAVLGSGRLALAAEVDGELAGMGIFSVLAPEAELELIAVGERWQRRGLACLIFEQAAVLLRAGGVTEVVLEVRESNGAARGLYARLGFEERARRRGYYADPVEDALILGLELGDR